MKYAEPMKLNIWRIFRMLFRRHGITFAMAMDVYLQWRNANECWKSGLAVRRYCVNSDVFIWYYKDEMFNCDETLQELLDIGAPYAVFKNEMTVPVEVLL